MGGPPPPLATAAPHGQLESEALELFSDASGALSAASELVEAFCAQLHERGFAIVRLPACAHAEATAVRAAAREFFALDQAQKRDVGDFRAVGDTYVGYRDASGTRQDCDAEFLEVHLNNGGHAFPDPPGCGVGPAAAALYSRLFGIARVLLQLLAAHIGVPADALLAPIDPPSASELPEGSLTSSVLRLCHYRSAQTEATGRAVEADDAPAAAPARRGADVLFDEHTDSSLLTLSILCPAAAGLELRDPLSGGGWLAVEQLPHVTPFDVEVHVGDFLAFLTRDHYRACSHRVTRPLATASAGGPPGEGRLSMPFLVRARAGHVMDTRQYDPGGANAHLVEVEGVRCGDLRRLFDARGKRMLDAKRDATRDAAQAEAERKERARAYREALLAGRPLSPLDSSDDDEPPPSSMAAARSEK